jgi:uncharacterized membrane protein (DUF485 family)
MDQQIVKMGEAPTRTLVDLDRPANWLETLLALVPFLLWPLLLLFRQWMTNPSFGAAITVFMLSILLVALLIGWVKGFPRWCFPYWGFVILIALYFQNFRGTIFGKSFSGSWLVWIPLLAIILIGILWTRDPGSIYRMFRSLWVDWTRLSFAFYGLLPLMLIAIYDEVGDIAAQPALTGLMLVQAGGALLYMRSSRIWPRFLWLLAGFSISWILATIHLAWYWNGRQEPGMGAPATWGETLSWAGPMGAFLLVILIAPVLLGGLRLLRRGEQSLNS